MDLLKGAYSMIADTYKKMADEDMIEEKRWGQVIV